MRDYKSYTRNDKDEYHVNALNDNVDWRKDLNLPPTYDTYGITIPPSTIVREFNKQDVIKWPPKTNKPKANPESKLWCHFAW